MKLKSFLLATIVLLGSLSAIGCSKKKTTAPALPKFDGKLAELVPKTANSMLIISDLPQVSRALVRSLKTIFPSDYSNWLDLIKRLSAIDFAAADFTKAGIKADIGIVCYQSPNGIVVGLGLTNYQLFQKSIKRLFKFLGHRRWTTDGRLHHLNVRRTQAHFLTMTRYLNIGFLVFSLNGKRAVNLSKALTQRPKHNITQAAGWPEVAATTGARFLLNPGQLLPENIQSLFEYASGSVQATGKKIDFRFKLKFNPRYIKDLRVWFTPKSEIIPAQRFIANSSVGTAKLDVNFAELSGLLQIVKLLTKVDVSNPLKKLLPPTLSAVRDPLSLFDGRFLIVLEALKKMPTTFNSRDPLAFLEFFRFGNVMQMAKPKLVREILEKLSTTGTGATHSGFSRLRLRKIARDDFELRNKSNRLLASICMRGDYLVASPEAVIAKRLCRRFTAKAAIPSVAKSARFKRLMLRNRLASGFLSIENLVEQLIDSGIPPGILATIRKFRTIDFGLNVNAQHLTLRITVSL